MKTLPDSCVFFFVFRAIQWNLHYYYNGCMSWSWFFPHHFAPYITDIKDFSGMELTFEMSEPFLPYEQLLSVLPAASKALLPPTLQGLMEEDWSPILDYYPPGTKYYYIQTHSGIT